MKPDPVSRHGMRGGRAALRGKVGACHAGNFRQRAAMVKRAGWLVAILAFVALGIWKFRPSAGRETAKQATEVDRPETQRRVVGRRISETAAETDQVRESPRHSVDDLTKSKLDVRAKLVRDLERQQTVLEAQAAELRRAEGDERLAYAASLDLPDNTTKILLPKYNAARLELETYRKSGIGEAHPIHREKVAEIEKLKGDLDHGVANLEQLLDGQLKITVTRLKLNKSGKP